MAQRRCIFAGLLLALTLPASAQRPASTSPAYRAQLIERLADELERGYVLPDVGAAMAARLRAKLRSGKYNAFADVEDVVTAALHDLDSVRNDRHLAVTRADGRGGPRITMAPANAGPPQVIADIKVLPGNLGYLRLDEFFGVEELAAPLDTAMRTLQHTDALILDLRTNRGGDPSGMLYLAGFFLERPTLLARVYSRLEDSTTDMRSATVKGPSYLGKHVYILTSKRTFSAAEAAAYHFAHSPIRAVVVGDTTGGGAHRIRTVKLNDDYNLVIPYTRPINVETNGDWDGVGVIPAVPTASANALVAAQRSALEALPRTPERSAALHGLNPPARRATPAGTLTQRVLFDSSYHRARRVWIYTPPGYDAKRATTYPLIVAFDGAEYRDTLPLPRVLDSLAAAGAAPAYVAALVDDSIGATRIADLGNSARMPQFLARQLIPFVRRGWHVTTDPRRVIVTGSSAGGLAAAYVAFMRPELFGNVWSQSGAFWRGTEASNDAPYEWLTAQVRATGPRPVRFMLDVGAGEDHPTLGGSGPNFRDANRRFRDALLAKKYEVIYMEVPGGQHDPDWWTRRLALGIVELSK